MAGMREMRKAVERSMIALAAILVLSSMVMAQGEAKPGSKGSLYNGNRLKTDPAPGGPAPVHDVSGSWAGNLVPTRLQVPPLTPLGAKLAALNHSEPQAGTGNSNDPGNTCDPLGVPRSLEGSGSLAGITFATLPDRIAVLHDINGYGVTSGWTASTNCPRKSTPRMDCRRAGMDIQ